MCLSAVKRPAKWFPPSIWEAEIFDAQTSSCFLLLTVDDIWHELTHYSCLLSRNLLSKSISEVNRIKNMDANQLQSICAALQQTFGNVTMDQRNAATAFLDNVNCNIRICSIEFFLTIASRSPPLNRVMVSLYFKSRQTKRLEWMLDNQRLFILRIWPLLTGAERMEFFLFLR